VSETVRLSASRALLGDMMKVATYAGMEDRMTEIEEQLIERAGDANQTG
jgi:hypothetical protein